MANIAAVVIGDVEVGAEKVLDWLKDAGKVVTKAGAAEPQVIAALGTLLGAVGIAVADTAADAAAPSFALTSETFNAVKAVWPDITAFMATLGVKL
jgi:hypothetical protein